MELQDIQEKIINLLVGIERKIVFGYDDDASYADDIDALQLEDGCKVLKLTGRKEEIYRIIIGSSNITSAALTKNNRSWEGILIIEGWTVHQGVTAAYHKEPEDPG